VEYFQIEMTKLELKKEEIIKEIDKILDQKPTTEIGEWSKNIKLNTLRDRLLRVERMIKEEGESQNLGYL